MSACGDGSELARSLEGNGIGSDPMRMIMIHSWIISVTLSILAWAIHSSDAYYVVDYAINPEICYRAQVTSELVGLEFKADFESSA
ncbi:uncharacterized protein ARMOST_17164 [Armillaria ostoyae]|uniref:Uncharacterized protein n=1 Tax=Armillaria ostoyae TaxID=47428 RepID=A0A284RY95_ARMOS|nr:uncharacterized protein ARMOST_17164 [Armillaria ostoyae]